MQVRRLLKQVVILVVALLIGAFDRGAAQARSAKIKGILFEATQKTPIEGGRVVLVGTDFKATTDARGEFEFGELEPGRYVIQVVAIGYTMLSSPLILRERETLEVELEAEAEAVRLPDLTVEERATNGPADWLRRKTEGRGRYITRADIDERRAATVTDALRAIPGLRLECRGLIYCQVRMARSGRNCGPGYYIDGIPADPAVVYLTPISEVEGIEVYTGPAETPPELEGAASRCGVVVLWTRTPPPRRPKKPKKPKPAPVPDSTKTDSLEANPRLPAGLALRW